MSGESRGRKGPGSCTSRPAATACHDLQLPEVGSEGVSSTRDQRTRDPRTRDPRTCEQDT